MEIRSLRRENRDSLSERSSTSRSVVRASVLQSECRTLLAQERGEDTDDDAASCLPSSRSSYGKCGVRKQGFFASSTLTDFCCCRVFPLKRDGPPSLMHHNTRDGGSGKFDLTHLFLMMAVPIPQRRLRYAACAVITKAMTRCWFDVRAMVRWPTGRLGAISRGTEVILSGRRGSNLGYILPSCREDSFNGRLFLSQRNSQRHTCAGTRDTTQTAVVRIAIRGRHSSATILSIFCRDKLTE